MTLSIGISGFTFVLFYVLSNRRHVEANRSAEIMLGYEPGGLLETLIADLPAEEMAEPAARHFEEIRASGQADGNFLLRRKDGSRVWLSIRASKLPGDRFMAMFQDITEQKQAEESLHRSEAEFRAMFEVASIGMAQADPHTGQWTGSHESLAVPQFRNRFAFHGHGDAGRHDRAGADS
jgi:PAS domain S-box-containing protein